MSVAISAVTTVLESSIFSPSVVFKDTILEADACTSLDTSEVTGSDILVAGLDSALVARSDDLVSYAVLEGVVTVRPVEDLEQLAVPEMELVGVLFDLMLR